METCVLSRTAQLERRISVPKKTTLHCLTSFKKQVLQSLHSECPLSFCRIGRSSLSYFYIEFHCFYYTFPPQTHIRVGKPCPAPHGSDSSQSSGWMGRWCRWSCTECSLDHPGGHRSCLPGLAQRLPTDADVCLSSESGKSRYCKGEIISKDIAWYWEEMYFRDFCLGF